MRYAFFISDAHLGTDAYTPSKQRELKLIKLLRYIQDRYPPKETNIILLGDIFDFWFEWKHSVPAGFVRLLGTLADLTDSGYKTYFLPGNHDQWTFGYLSEEVGIEVVPDPWTPELNSKKFFISHGHKIPPLTLSERLINTLFESSIARKMFKFVHPDLGIWIAKKWSHTSRQNHPDVPPRKALEKYEKFITQMEKRTHYDFYLFAHLHYPIIKRIGNSVYVNTGDWLTHFSFAIFDGNTIKLARWED
ncbi:MAG: UDP-2,3-diacylglucosamine diphosphatase [Chlorobi bacterium]|nr:UDP-2,3-diacylglucosamine diphosphatase [Chlorobiota bacterium]